jgi:hypothetical protein
MLRRKQRIPTPPMFDDLLLICFDTFQFKVEFVNCSLSGDIMDKIPNIILIQLHEAHKLVIRK